MVTTPKAEEPAVTTPKAEELTSKEAKAKKELADAQKDGKDIIEGIASSKLSEIEKVKDEAEKAKLKAKLKELKEAGLEAINNAKDHDAAVTVADEYQTKIDEINSYITEDPLKATYLIDEALLQYQYSKEYQEILNSLRNKALFQIKKVI